MGHREDCTGVISYMFCKNVVKYALLVGQSVEET